MTFFRETGGAARMALLLLWRRRWVAAGLLLAVLAGGVLPFSLSAAAPGKGLWSLRALYGNGVSFAALSVFAMVAGVAAFARDAAGRIMPGLLVTPARRISLVLGRFLALAALLSFLWFLACALTFSAARAGAREDGGFAPCARFAYEIVPLARVPGERPSGAEGLAADVLPAGATGGWRAEAPVPRRPAEFAGADVDLRLSATGALEAGGELPLRVTVSGSFSDSFVLRSGAETVRPCPAGAADTGAVSVSNDGAFPVWFSRAAGISLGYPVSGAGANFARGALVGAAHLALLASLGIALGALFHPAEALFFALALLLTLGVSSLAGEAMVQTREEFVASVSRFGGVTGAEPSKAARAAATAAYGAYRATQTVLAPLADAGRLSRLSASEAIGPGEVLGAVALKALLLPLLLSLAAATGLSKREAFAG
jgi:hypothetical protein